MNKFVGTVSSALEKTSFLYKNHDFCLKKNKTILNRKTYKKGLNSEKKYSISHPCRSNNRLRLKLPRYIPFGKDANLNVTNKVNRQ